MYAMKIRDLEARLLDIPFRLRFKHHSADRSRTQAILVRTRTQTGQIGFGEGCPRQYVTGETLNSCLEFVKRHTDALTKEICTLDKLKDWLECHERDIDSNPAAWCAIELSLLDVISKELGQNIEETLSAPAISGEFSYTAVLGDNSEAAFSKLISQYVQLGFDDFKVKITGNADTDNKKLELIYKAAPDARLRLDANNIWTTVEDVLLYLDALASQPFALEEPLSARKFDVLNRLLARTSVPIILDESFLNKHHLDLINTEYNNVIVNVRVSKMGGLLRARSVAHLLSVAKIPIVIGAQVGETSLLTRAGLSIANEFKDHVLAQEGAFGTLLLETDITDEPLMFGPQGRLIWPSTGTDTSINGMEIRYKSNLFSTIKSRP
jgi:L-alanine-DL-glutamate epimerase-like enolase superfamily enzyme